MIQIQSFAFNPFQENMYVLYDEKGDCIIVDPGCYSANEQNTLVKFIEDNNLTPTQLVNTHCHLDHIAGNKFVKEKWDLKLGIPEGEIPVMKGAPQHGLMYGFVIEPSPEPDYFIKKGDVLPLGEEGLKVISCPGHSPDHMVFYSAKQDFIIGGDVLFYGSIGRTDLPGGDHQTLIDSIKRELWPLPDETKVYPGHGPSTTIGFEKVNNPYLR